MYQNSKNTDDQKRLKETKYLLDWELIPSRTKNMKVWSKLILVPKPKSLSKTFFPCLIDKTTNWKK